MHHLFYSILCFYLMLFCQNVAAVMSWAENHSVRECELVFVFSCAIIWSSIARTNLCFPFLCCPFNAAVTMGKGGIFPQTSTVPHTSLQEKSSRMVCIPRCQPIPGRMQTFCTSSLLHWMTTREKYWVFAQTRSQRTSVCRNWGEKWSGKHFPVNYKLVECVWLDGQA